MWEYLLVTRILSVSNDKSLLESREMLLRESGYEVTSAWGASEGLKHCTAKFDLLIIGHSMPHEEKQSLVKAFRARNSAPVLALHREDEQMLEGADFEIPPDPEVVVSAVASLTANRTSSAS
jgi:DNA-binding response OmpR family regulator